MLKSKGMAPSFRLLHLLEVFGEEIGHVFELWDVGGINLHESLVRFETGAGDLLAIARGGGLLDGREAVVVEFRTAHDLEKMFDTEIFEEVRDARIGIEQLDGPNRVSVASIAEFEAQPGEDAEKGAIHQNAFGEIKDEAAVAFVSKPVDEGFEIDAGIEIGAALKANPSDFILRPDRHGISGCTHRYQCRSRESARDMNCCGAGAVIHFLFISSYWPPGARFAHGQFAPESAATQALRPSC